MIFDTKKNTWEQGPNLIEKRADHSCFYDEITNQLYVFGGYGDRGKKRLESMETWKVGTNKFEVSSILPVPISNSGATSSNSDNYVGYLVGGQTNNGATNKVWGLRRRDLTWIEMESLQQQKKEHSIVNVVSSDVLGC